MKTVFVRYGKWHKGHPILDDEYVKSSEIIEVENLLDINRMYDDIIDVKVLDHGNENIHTKEDPFSDEGSK